MIHTTVISATARAGRNRGGAAGVEGTETLDVERSAADLVRQERVQPPGDHYHDRELQSFCPFDCRL